MKLGNPHGPSRHPGGLIAVSLVALFSASCGASQSPQIEPPADNEWASFDFEERHERMTLYVLPAMARRFRQHRNTEFATLTCLSCHGPDAEAVDYRMPNGLLPLDPQAMPDTEEARWMAEVVVPSFDRSALAGGTTTCYSCHEREIP